MAHNSYNVQELLDMYAARDIELVVKCREKSLDDVWKSIRAAVAFGMSTTMHRMCVVRDYQDDKEARDLFDFLQGELAKIGNFKCKLEQVDHDHCIAVTWGRFDLKLPAQ